MNIFLHSMEKELHIQAYGDVDNAQFSGVSEYGIISLKSIADQIASNPEAEEIIVHIHSRGGDVDEGFAIHDLLQNSGKKITTIIEGLCASIATVIALAGSTRKMTANSSFFIHNPWTFGMGNADELERTSELTRIEEDKLIDFYQKKTSGDREKISNMMKQETKMTPEEAKSLGFITEVLQDSKAFKAYAKFHNQNKTNEMNKVLQQLNDLLQKHGIKASTEVQPPVEIKNLDLEVKGETEKLHVETEATEAAIGDFVTMAGAAVPDREFTLEDGTVIKTDADAKISAITKPVEEPTVAASELMRKHLNFKRSWKQPKQRLLKWKLPTLQ